jgi:hypothetical protein
VRVKIPVGYCSDLGRDDGVWDQDGYTTSLLVIF